MDCTSESLPDPADELLPPGQLLQTLTPGLIDVLQQLFGTDKLLVDPVQFFMAKVVQDSLKKSSKQVVKESAREGCMCTGTGSWTPQTNNVDHPNSPSHQTSRIGRCIKLLSQIGHCSCSSVPPRSIVTTVPPHPAFC